MAGPGSARPGHLRPDQLDLEGRLFDIKIFRFNPTEDVSLLEQYFRKNVVNYRDSGGAYLETVEHNWTRVLKDFPEARRLSLMRKWLDGLEKDHADLVPRLDAARLFLSWLHHAEGSDPVREADADALRREARKALEGLEVSPWTQLTAGLIVDLVGPGDPPAEDAEALPTAIDLWERSSEAAGNEDAHLHFVLGDLLTNVLDPKIVPVYCKKIATEYEKALLISPSDKQLYAAVAGRYHEIYESLSSQDASLPFWFEELVFKRLIAVEPTNARAHNNLSFLYSQYGVNLKEALKEAQIANQLMPGEPNLMDTLGWAYYKLGNAEKAVEVLSRALQIDDGLADLHFHLATVLYDLENFEQAVEHFRATVALDPENAFAFNNLAYLFSERGSNLKEGLELVERALELDPENSAFLDTKGWLFYRLGRYDEADAFVSKAIALQPEVGELHLHAGQIALARGRYLAATDHFEKSLTYDPQNQELARTLARIYALDGLRQGLTRFARIRRVQREKENFEVFYRAMAEVYQTDRLYDEAIEALTRYRDLPDGEPPGVGDGAAHTPQGPPEVTPRGPVDADFDSAIRSLPASTDMVVTVEHPGLVGLLDLIIQAVRLPFPLAPFRDQIASHLPHRIAVGFDADGQGSSDGPSNVALLQFSPEEVAAMAARLQEAGDTKLTVPGMRRQVALRSGSYKGRLLGTVGVPGLVIHYAVLDGAIALSRRKSALVGLLDQPRSASPPLTEQAGFKDFVPRLADGTHAVLVADIPALLAGGAGGELGDDERSYLQRLALVCSQYTLDLTQDALTEVSMLYAAEGKDLAGTSLDAERFARKSVGRFPASEMLEIETRFGEVEGRIEGRLVLRGVKAWAQQLLERLGQADVGLPDLDIGDGEDEDGEEEDEIDPEEGEDDEGSK